jgi:hypothetical protein
VGDYENFTPAPAQRLDDPRLNAAVEDEDSGACSAKHDGLAARHLSDEILISKEGHALHALAERLDVISSDESALEAMGAKISHKPARIHAAKADNIMASEDAIEYILAEMV